MFIEHQLNHSIEKNIERSCNYWEATSETNDYFVQQQRSHINLNNILNVNDIGMIELH